MMQVSRVVPSGGLRSMAAEFDPYYKWLGIHPKDQPPHHYRLLSVEVFESDPEVIEAAADRHIAYLQDVAAGPYMRQSQRILNEIAVARLCLLDPNRKAAYDAELRARLVAGADSPATKSVPPVADPPPPRVPSFDEPPVIETAGTANRQTATSPTSRPRQSSVLRTPSKARRQPLGPTAKLALFAGVIGTVVMGCGLVVFILLTAPKDGAQESNPADDGSASRGNATVATALNGSDQESRSPVETQDSPGGIDSPDWNISELDPPSFAGPDLVAHYTFEPSDPRGSGESGEHGLPLANATWAEGTQPGTRALALGGERQPCRIPCPIQGDFTITCWIKTNQTGDRGTKWHEGIGIVTDGDELGTDSDFGVSLIEDRVAFGMGPDYATVKSKQSVSDGEWYHVAAVRVSSSGTVRLYVDGELQYSKTKVDGPATFPSQLMLGGSQTNPARFEASLDDLRFYDLALAKSQIRAVMDETRPPDKK
jgi:hypothetical protein